MAEEITRKHFEDLIKAQRDTNKLLEEQSISDAKSNTKAASFVTNFGEIITEVRGQVESSKHSKLAKKESDETQVLLGEIEEAGKGRDNKQTKILTGLASQGKKAASAAYETEQDTNLTNKKQNKLMAIIAKGFVKFDDFMKGIMKKTGRGLLGFFKGTLLAGVILALLAFFNSDYWEAAKNNIANFMEALKDGFQFADLAILFNIGLCELREKFLDLKTLIIIIGGALLLSTLIPGFGLGLAIAIAADQYFGWGLTGKAFEGIKTLICEITEQMTSWQAALIGILSVAAAASIFLKGKFRLLAFIAGGLGIGKLFKQKKVPVSPVTAQATAGVASAHALASGTVVKTKLSPTGYAKWQGQSFGVFDKSTGVTGPAAKGMTNVAVMGSIEKGALSRIMRVVQVVKAHPFLGKMLGFVKPAALGYLLWQAVTEGMGKGDIESRLAGAIVGTYGAAGGATIGAAIVGSMLGLAAGAPLGIGALLMMGAGGVAGGITGAMLGNAAGMGLAQWILGKEVNAFPEITGINEMINTGSFKGTGIKKSGGGMFNTVVQAVTGLRFGAPSGRGGDNGDTLTDQSNLPVENESDMGQPRGGRFSRSIRPDTSLRDFSHLSLKKAAGPWRLSTAPIDSPMENLKELWSFILKKGEFLDDDRTLGGIYSGGKTLFKDALPTVIINPKTGLPYIPEFSKDQLKDIELMGNADIIQAAKLRREFEEWKVKNSGTAAVVNQAVSNSATNTNYISDNAPLINTHWPMGFLYTNFN